MELNLEQIKMLEDLATHEGWIVYQGLLKEKWAIALDDMRNAKDWPDFIESRAMANLIEFDITPLVSDTIAEWQEDHKASVEEPEKIEEEV
mgnify:CR=1 FL=1